MAGSLTRRAPSRLTAIRLERVSVRLGRHWALRDASFELEAGERWLVTGPNGAGKTVLLKLLRGDLWPTPTGHGRRRYRCDDEWQEQPLYARERIAYLGPERQDRYDRHGFDLRVAEVVATGLTGDDLLLDVPTRAQWRAVRRALEDVGLAGLAGRRFLTLSHGQRRRVLLARALVGRPDVLLLDEVLNGLDLRARRAFLRALARASGPRLAWVLTTHRPLPGPRTATHVARMDSGRLVVGEQVPSAPRTIRREPPSRARARRGDATPLIELRRASVFRDGRRVVGPLDWRIDDGEHWAISGPNGAGKSTLLATLYGDFAPAAGGVILRRDCPPGTPLEEWKSQVGIVSPELQSTYAATACTAEEIVISGLHSSIGLDASPTVAERTRARRWLARVGLRGLGARRARELSYGQLRRALVARALVAPRSLLLLDEPFDGLDAEAHAVIARELLAAARRGAQLVLATHHPHDVPAFVTRRLVLPVRRRRNAS